MSSKRLIIDGFANSCYFRTSVEDGQRKALVQVTQRCGLHCAHCFVSATTKGLDISLENMRDRVIPRLVRAGVQRFTLTGGEPFAHPQIVEICGLIVSQGFPVTICTNAAQTTDKQIAALAAMGDVLVNISFDGFRPESHGKFRGDRDSFAVTVETARKFAAAGLLKGLLSTPNLLTSVEEFTELCAFAVELGAEYVLMNPLSSFGRGTKSKQKLAAPADMMRAIRQATAGFAADGRLDMVYIRFPNDSLPLAGCDAGKLIYVFADGAVAICPYLVFAADTPQSQHAREQFLAGNILTGEVAGLLDGYDMRQLAMGANDTCAACSLNGSCGKGCPAAVVANGGRIGSVDLEQCPRPLLTIGRRPAET